MKKVICDHANRDPKHCSKCWHRMPHREYLACTSYNAECITKTGRAKYKKVNCIPVKEGEDGK